jgi:hypothetical protein
MPGVPGEVFFPKAFMIACKFGNQYEIQTYQTLEYELIKFGFGV